jgi:hypothetical protein
VLSLFLFLGRLLSTPGAPPPEEVSDRALLFIKNQTVIDCTVDAGVDDGGLPDIDAGTDAGTPIDAGVPPDAMTDAGPDAGTCTGLDVVETVTMIVQPELGTVYPDSEFALLYVTPQRAQVTTHEEDIFGDLAIATAPMIEKKIVYIEDPARGEKCSSSGCGSAPREQESSGGCGAGYESSSWDPPTITDGGADNTGIETIGPYEIVRAQPADARELEDWLTQLGYHYKEDDVDAVAPYLALDYHVVAVRLSAKRQTVHRTTPLGFTWAGNEIRIPAALGRATLQPLSQIPLTVYIAAEQRYDLPQSNITFAMPTSYGNSGYLTRNEVTLDTNQPPSADPVAAANGSFDYRATEVVTEERRVPVSVVCNNDDAGLGCGACSTSTGMRRRQIDFGTIALAALIALRRRRRPRT